MDLKDQIRILVVVLFSFKRIANKWKKKRTVEDKQANDLFFSLETFVKGCGIILVFKNIPFELVDLLITIIISK